MTDKNIESEVPEEELKSYAELKGKKSKKPLTEEAKQARLENLAKSRKNAAEKKKQLQLESYIKEQETEGKSAKILDKLAKKIKVKIDSDSEGVSEDDRPKGKNNDMDYVFTMLEKIDKRVGKMWQEKKMKVKKAIPSQTPQAPVIINNTIPTKNAEEVKVSKNKRESILDSIKAINQRRY